MRALLLLFICYSICFAWVAPTRTSDRATNQNFEDLSVTVVDNYSDQSISGAKTFSNIVLSSATATNLTVTHSTFTNITATNITVVNATITENVLFSSYTHVAAYLSGDQTLSGTASLEKVLFDSESYDTINEFNVATSSFTAKYSGKYSIKVDVYAGAVSGTFGLYILKNGAIVKQKTQSAPAAMMTETVSMTISLNAGDIIHISHYNNTGNPQTLSGTERFSGLYIDRIP